MKAQSNEINQQLKKIARGQIQSSTTKEKHLQGDFGNPQQIKKHPGAILVTHNK
jgi:hypothetical protein